MSGTAILMMIVILGVIWGGFIAALRTAMKKESEKTEAEA